MSGHHETNGDAARPEEEIFSRATAGRLSLYLRCLEDWHRQGRVHVSSREFARVLGVTDSQVRKDLARLGHMGRRGVGYATEELIQAIRRQFGTDRTWRAVLVGVGNLARALLRYQGFRDRGFEIVGLFDADPTKVGQEVGGLVIQDVTKLSEEVPRLRGELALLTVPASSAQIVADSLIAVGIRGILNFAPTVLQLPPMVQSVAVDFSIQLEQLALRVRLGEEVGRLSDTYPVV